MLTEKQQAINYITMRHIERVRNLINKCVNMLLKCGENHDQTKLETPEVELFAEYTDKLADVEYNSDEYRSYLVEMQVALEHHYGHNRHHPEHHKSGIDDMDLIDMVEMFCDWKAASERHNTGNILKSIETNADRFSMSPQLIRIFENTAKRFG